MKYCLPVLYLVFSWYSRGQDSLSYSEPNFVMNYPNSIIKSRMYSVAATELGTYIAGISFLQFIWYTDHEREPFHFYNDNKGYLQMDKLGHAYSAYHESYNAYYALRWAGMSKKKALLFGGPMGLVMQTPIEIYDGLYEGWGFSWGDMGANAFGSALFIAQQLVWKEQRVLMKFTYSNSGYSKYHHNLGETPVEQFFLDYNGHTYWLSGNMKQLFGLDRFPPWLNLAIGHSGNGMIKEFENPTTYEGKPFPYLERYRQWLFSLDIDFTRIHTNKKWVASLLSYLNVVKIPFPALELNRVDGLKFRPLYF